MGCSQLCDNGTGVSRYDTQVPERLETYAAPMIEPVSSSDQHAFLLGGGVPKRFVSECSKIPNTSPKMQTREVLTRVHVEVCTSLDLSSQFATECFFAFHARFGHGRPQSSHDCQLEKCRAQHALPFGSGEPRLVGRAGEMR